MPTGYLREGEDLERLFARRSVRKLSKSLSFQYEGVVYQLKSELKNRLRATHVDILERAGKPLLIECGGKEYPYSKWEEVPIEKPRVLDSKELEAYWPDRTRKRPGKHHPWK